STGVVTVAGSLDAETSTSHTIEVTATSDDGSTSTQTFSIGVNDVNETSITAISDSDASGNTVTEGASVGTAVGITALASDADATDTVSYSLSSNPGGFFAIDANTGEVTVAGSLDYETNTSHSIEVTATSTDGTTSTQTFTIAVGDEDEHDVGAISDTNASGNSVDENAAAGTTVGIVASASDADATNSDITYSLTDDAGGLFTIDASTGEVTTTAPLDAETASSYDIKVTAKSEDGSTSTATFTVDVNNLIDEGPTDISFGMDDLIINGSFEDFVASSSNVYGSNSNDVEGWTAEHGGVIEMHVDGYGGTDATDGDYWMDGGTNADNAHISQVVDGANDGVSYNLTFDAADRKDSGEMEIYWGGELVATIDPDTTDMQSYSVEVVGGAGDGTNKLEFKEVGNVDNFGVALDNVQLVQNAVVENAAEGTIVATLSAEDADAGDTFTYAITNDPSGNFEISGNQIVVKAGADIDYEDATSHDITVEVTDAGGNTYSETVTINVADVNEAPTDITFSGNSDLDITGGNPTSVDAVVTGEIVSNGSNSSIDHFEISHNGGELTIDGLADGLNGSDLDMQFELLRDNGDGTYTSVGYNNDGASGSDGSTSNLDSYLNFSDLEAGDYLLAVGNINFDQSDVENTSSDYPTGYWNGSSETGEYQVTISGDATVAIAQNPDFGGTWGDPQNNISIVNDGSSPATIAAGSVIGSAESVADVDAGETFTYALADDADGKFEIDADTGEIKLVAEHDASSAYSETVDVQVTDAGGNTYIETVGIQLGTEDGETLTGTSNSDIMHGFGGQDTLNGGDGDDILVASDMSLDGGEITGSNLITNGGFENTSSGWTLNSGPGFQFYSDGDRSVNTTEGNYYLDMDEAPGNVDIEQALSGLTTGTSYQLSFDTAATGGYDASVEVYWNGELVDTITSDTTTMSSNTFTVVGGAGDGSDTIQFVEVGAVDYGGTALDNVQLFELSEPVGDTLNGGDGNDIMISATGNDTIDGGAGMDTVSYEGSDSAVDVNLNTDTLSGGDAEGDTLTSIENVTGSDHNDTITGDSANNTISGGDGNDTLDGGYGKDTLDGGAGDDILMAGYDDGTGDIFIGGEGNDTYQIEGTNVENHTFNIDLNTGSDQYDNSYSGIENINGGNGNDTFTGDANANIFSGNGGDDTMYGGDESDIFVFGEGDGADTVHGGAGGGWTDTIELSDAAGDLGTYGTDWTVSLTSGSVDAQDANSLTLSDDADGTITLADGSTVDFFEIERIEF
ncbi:MAG: cadherin domain-containing protein, partial [Lentilitoribacter sp.]